VKAEAFPLVGEIGPENFQRYVERGLPLVWMFLDNAAAETTAFLTAAEEAAKEVKGRLSVVKLDGVRWADHAKHFGVDASQLPGIVVEDRENQKNFVFPKDKEPTKENLVEHFKGFLDGTLQPNIKSQPVPDKNNGPVKTIVATTFDSIVMDNTKDVLVEFYAPWCGHCKSLAPKYKKLGKMFKDVPNVVIAQVDATENDVPAKIKGFPTILFYRAGDKSNPIEYKGERTEQALAKFVKEEGNTFKQGTATAEGEVDSEAAVPEHAHDEL